MDTEKIAAECPGCGAPVQISVSDIAAERTVQCPKGHSIDLKDEGGGARKLKQAMNDLEKTLKNFGKS